MTGDKDDAEIRALQAQINPHFLFNTLNTLSTMALLEGAGKTHQMLLSLSDLMRYSLRRSQGLVTLEEETAHVKVYLQIQQVTMGDRLKMRLDVPAELGGLGIPLLTLQPLVENAVIHGLEGKVEGGTVAIAGYLEEGGAVVEVRDDGCGMESDLAERLLLGEIRPHTGHTAGLGLSNVHQRLQYHFGPDFGLSLDSRPGRGTTVRVHLPAVNR